MALSRQDILGADDLETREVEVPEWGGTVYVRQLRGDEYEDYAAEAQDRQNGSGDVDFRGLRARLLVLSIVDENGDRVFGDGDEGELNAKSHDAITRLFRAAQELNGLGGEGVEELVGNSAGGPSGGSATD